MQVPKSKLEGTQWIRQERYFRKNQKRWNLVGRIQTLLAKSTDQCPQILDNQSIIVSSRATIPFTTIQQIKIMKSLGGLWGLKLARLITRPFKNSKRIDLIHRAQTQVRGKHRIWTHSSYHQIRCQCRGGEKTLSWVRLFSLTITQWLSKRVGLKPCWHLRLTWNIWL